MVKKTTSKAYLVESIPFGLEELADGKRTFYTAKVLKKLTDRAQETIDITAMYWNLTPDPTRTDEAGFTKEELRKKFGATEGESLYKSLHKAAQRGVKIRIIQSPGFDKKPKPSSDGVVPPVPIDESAELEKEFPKQVEIQPIDLPKWYASGIMHQKIWIFDNKDIYIGSANNDWKSFTQVKEMGVAVENNPDVAAELTQYFETWWLFCSIEPPTVRKGVIDPVVRINRMTPDWSELIPSKERARNPLNQKRLRSAYDWENPLEFKANGKSGGLVLSGSPAELCVGSRPEDIYTLVRTIMEAEKSVCVNVMDLAPVSLYARGEWDPKTRISMVDGKPASPVWWSQLFDALLHVATTKALQVRIIVSEWAHTSKFVTPYLNALQIAADAATVNSSMKPGTLEIRRFRIPGWEHTEDTRGDFTQGESKKRDFPGHTRVNHTKYIVTDNRANIGTSNMTWDYFVGTAGASFNTDHKDIVGDLQKLFDRDWDSPYVY